VVYRRVRNRGSDRGEDAARKIVATPPFRPPPFPSVTLTFEAPLLCGRLNLPASAATPILSRDERLRERLANGAASTLGDARSRGMNGAPRTFSRRLAPRGHWDQGLLRARRSFRRRSSFPVGRLVEGVHR
jgi:hypothetical protein